MKERDVIYRSLTFRSLLAAGLLGLGLSLAAMPAKAGETRSALPVPAAETAHPTDVSAQQRRQRPRAQRAPRARGQQIACTRFGCRPIPRNCRITTEFNLWTGNPTGFDAVVCR